MYTLELVIADLPFIICFKKTDRGQYMADQKDKNTFCTSVFKGDNDTTTKEIYTEKWVEVINALANGK